jgi:hypothetical protein
MNRICPCAFGLTLGMAILASMEFNLAAHGADGSRQSLRLDGQWQIAEGSMGKIPATFDHTVPVPGLVDLAKPAFEQPGATVPEAERRKVGHRPADSRREAFWYRRTFQVPGRLAPVALLKINKAVYGTKVFLNGRDVGEHAPNFTPGWFDVRPFLKGDGAMNELIVRVGASPVPQGAAIVASLAAGDQPRALTTSSDQTARCPSSNRSSLVSTRANPFGAGRDHGPRHRQWPTVNTTAASSAAFSW